MVGAARVDELGIGELLGMRFSGRAVPQIVGHRADVAGGAEEGQDDGVFGVEWALRRSGIAAGDGAMLVAQDWRTERDAFRHDREAARGHRLPVHPHRGVGDTVERDTVAHGRQVGAREAELLA